MCQLKLEIHYYWFIALLYFFYQLNLWFTMTLIWYDILYYIYIIVRKVYHSWKYKNNIIQQFAIFYWQRKLLFVFFFFLVRFINFTFSILHFDTKFLSYFSWRVETFIFVIIVILNYKQRDNNFYFLTYKRSIPFSKK